MPHKACEVCLGDLPTVREFERGRCDRCQQVFDERQAQRAAGIEPPTPYAVAPPKGAPALAHAPILLLCTTCGNVFEEHHGDECPACGSDEIEDDWQDD